MHHHRQRKEASVKRRVVGAPLFVVLGLRQGIVAAVERAVVGRLVSSKLEVGVLVPQFDTRAWYSRDEVQTIFAHVSNTLIGDVAACVNAGQPPTPRGVVFIFVSRSIAASAPLLQVLEFWTWPVPLLDRSGVDPAHPQHCCHDADDAAAEVFQAIKTTLAEDSMWSRIGRKLSQDSHAPQRLPPANFFHPSRETRLAETFRAGMRGEPMNLPRVQRARGGSLSSHVVGDRHHRDAHGRFFPRGKGEDGCLREPPPRADLDARRLWLNAAYRFGWWVGYDHEHYDVQRGRGEMVSPPDVYCARRKEYAKVPREYANIFLNDTVRDNDLFNPK
ncbi:MAG: hypothetical protein WCK01_00340 [Candidatus Uhrbacteria bacterium]